MGSIGSGEGGASASVTDNGGSGSSRVDAVSFRSTICGKRRKRNPNQPFVPHVIFEEFHFGAPLSCHSSLCCGGLY